MDEFFLISPSSPIIFFGFPGRLTGLLIFVLLLDRLFLRAEIALITLLYALLEQLDVIGSVGVETLRGCQVLDIVCY